MKKAYRIALGGALIAIAAVTLTNYSAWFVIPKMRGPILMQLKDPGSAQFANEFISPSKALCGQVNAKNGFGAYTGFEPFIITSGGELIFHLRGKPSQETDPKARQISEEIARLQALIDLGDAWDKHCK